MRRIRTAVLGGGLAGLSSAYHLGGQASVYEAHTTLGGLCSQVRSEGFRFDAVPHVLHFQNASIRALVDQLVEGRLIQYSRRACVLSNGVLTRYPFQAHLHGLPSRVIEECLRGRLEAQGGHRAGTQDFEKWIRSNFGNGIARHFMIPYNTKFWTLNPSELTADWVRGIVPVPTYDEVLRGAYNEDPTEYGYNIKFSYPATGGLGAVLEGLLKRLPEIHLGKRLVGIDTHSRRLKFSDEEVVEYEHLLSSIPLPELRSLLNPLPLDVAGAFDSLRWTSVTVVHLGVRGQPAVPWHWCYYPDPDVIFYRVGIPSHYSSDAAPQGHHILSVEIAHSSWKPLDSKTLVPRTIGELVQLGILKRPRDISVVHPVELRYGYPVYDRNYQWATTHLRRYLRKQGITPLGRFGSWRYLSMEETLLDGQGAAQAIADTTDHAPVLR